MQVEMLAHQRGGLGKARMRGLVDFSKIAQCSQQSLENAVRQMASSDTHHVRVQCPGVDFEFDRMFVDIAISGASLALCSGAPHCPSATRAGPASQLLELYQRIGRDAPNSIAGRYSAILVDFESACALLATDRFAVEPMCYAASDTTLGFSDRADAVPAHAERRLDLQALFSYLYFHVIPAPRTVFDGVSRLPGGHRFTYRVGRTSLERYWIPRFEEDRCEPLDRLAEEFRDLVRAAVSREVVRDRTGAFLSGGTDSSTISGMLASVTGRPATTFSIGFDVRGYDEMQYASIAARHFGNQHREYYISPEDLVSGIPRVAAHYDQPFGNSSALPAYYCAQHARREGIDKLLAGDGGDELFGGNTRYAKQKIFEAYWNIPGTWRTRFIEPIMLGSSVLRRLPVAKKAVSYLEQARVKMPDRLNRYNLLFRLGMDRVLTTPFLEQVSALEPLWQQQATYDAVPAKALVNRMLAYDWKYTLADNDLPKVVGTAQLAGVSVGFPFLDNDIVDFSLKLAPALKVKGLKLRWFFKEALRGFLPQEVLRKRKHGFGLPFGIWTVQDRSLRRLTTDSLVRLVDRGVVRADFIEELMNELLIQHPDYYGEMVWILTMLEQWMSVQAPEYRLQ